MTPEQIKELKRIIALTAVYFGKDLKPEVIGLMANDLVDLEFEKVVGAYRTIRLDPKTRQMPLPAQIRAIAAPQTDAEAKARDAIERIKLAISRFGWTQGNEARLFIGQVGWAIVEGLGGWVRTCESDFLHNPGLIAQARQRAKDLVEFPNDLGTFPMLASNATIEAPKAVQELLERTKKIEA